MTAGSTLLYSLLAPWSVLLLGVGFVIGWWYRPGLRYLLWSAAAMGLFAFAMLVQIVGWPQAPLANAMLSTWGYLGASWLFTRSMAERLRAPFHRWLALGVGLATSALVALAVQRQSYLGHVMALNFGIGALLLLPCWRVWILQVGSAINRALRALHLLLGASFFARPLLMSQWYDATPSAAAFRGYYWLVLQVTVVAFVLGYGALMLYASMTGRDGLLGGDSERDEVTGLPNQSGFRARARHWCAEDGAQRMVLLCGIEHAAPLRYGEAKTARESAFTALAQCLRECLRAHDVLARHGPAECIVLLSADDARETQAVVQRVQALWALYQQRLALSPSEQGALCFGWAHWPEGTLLESAIQQAEAQLYAERAARLQAPGA